MTIEEINRMAREAGLHLPYWLDEQDPKKDPPRWTMVSPLPHLLERFAALAAEREPLTEEQIEDIWEKAACYEDDTLNIVAFARDIEAAHGIRERGAG